MVGFNTNTVDRIPARQAINTVEIFSSSDFPDAVSGTPDVITLADDTTYFIQDNITLPNDTVIKTGVNSLIFGLSRQVTSITGNAAFPLIETDGTNPITMRDLSVINVSGDAAAETLRIASTTANIAQIMSCSFQLKPVRVHSGSGVLFSDTFFVAGSSLIQGGDGGLGGRSIILDDLCAFTDGGVPVPGGLFQFEADSETTTVALFGTAFIMQGFGTVGVVVDEGIGFLNVILFDSLAFLSIVSEHFGIKAENPDDFNRALITGLDFTSQFGGSGELFICEPVVSSSVDITVADGNIFGVGITGTGDGQTSPGPGGNMIVSKFGPSTRLIFLKEGLTDTDHLSPITSPNLNPRGVTWHKGDLYSCDSTGGAGGSFVYKHTGFSATIQETLNPVPPGNIAGIVFVGENLVTSTQAGGLVSIFDGFSTTLLESFDSPFTQTAGIAYDGVNLLISDNDSTQVAVMKGVSEVVQYFFDTTAVDGRGIACIPGDGLLVADLSSNAVDIYDHPVTLDHSSRTWDVMESPDITLSSDRGGSFFFGETGIAVNLTVAGEWTDIVGVDLFYAPFSQVEKCFLDNEVNGELEWTGIRDRARTITAQATVERSVQAGIDVIYQIAVCIDGIPIADSFATIVAVSGGQAGQTIQTISTLPISRDLVAGQTIRIQVRNNTNTLDPLITSSRISIT